MQSEWDQIEIDQLLSSTQVTSQVVSQSDVRLGNLEVLLWVVLALQSLWLGMWVYALARRWVGRMS